MLDRLSHLNEAHAYLFIGAIIIILKIVNLLPISWFWIILTLAFPFILSIVIFIGIFCYLAFGFYELKDKKKNKPE